MSGYVRIHRALLEHPAFRNGAEAMAFAWMVARAQWKQTRVRYKDRILTLERGQLAISQRDMAHALDRDKAWVERLWKRLKIEAMIEAGCEAGVAVITICNYDKFQSSAPKGEAPVEADARQAQGTEQRREEGKKEETEAKASYGRLLDRWNEGAGLAGLSKIRVIDNSRKQKLRCRLNEHGEEVMLEAIDRVFSSDFLTGKTREAYRANFDFILQPESLRKLLEGFYGGEPAKPTLNREQQAESLEGMVRLYERMGKTVEAHEARKKLEALSGGNAAVAAKVQNITGGLFRAA